MQMPGKFPAGMRLAPLVTVTTHPAPGPRTPAGLKDNGQAFDHLTVVPLFTTPARKRFFLIFRNH
jgi:hypothetical protein